MLEFRLTKQNAGIVLWGDYVTLKRMHSFVHRINEDSPWIEDKEGFVLNFTYDVRKAFEGQRRKGTRRLFDEDACMVFGVEMLWPMLIAQVGMLRHAMGFVATTKLEQSIMYELEHVVEDAIRKVVPAAAEDVIQQMSQIGSTRFDIISGILNSRCSYFVGLPGPERKKKLPDLMASFHWMYGMRSSDGAPLFGDIPPEAFRAAAEEWPDFKW